MFYQPLEDLLSHLVGPGLGIEIVSQVNNIPKGSRLAVSTTLLAALVSVCMRATGQAASLTGQLQEHERRLVLPLVTVKVLPALSVPAPVKVSVAQKRGAPFSEIA